ncbi:MerR family redox-sensitive transcriptional activator SoxR [Kribbella sp. VKM Ac-2527]|jgi:MerR family redox-sensitive transcriptional activator SoxR|uniref:MerR family redox-sensitive transcriptional activator SoxR n=1 Tax=Kribbella caucasensis TaxID=2512215 RepID=A0A4R6J806_9ACTN|nr:redox-sensitive transcriptional activator SoxR [Kribbella sp. VKM Ac-2527]TDO31021.1 MerR family redox-sensitive transcriptional activator SoxR [Kribbella sp. VKM Ac-2527]
MAEENVPSKDHWLPIGEIAGRSGVAASALRFYEDQGLISSRRTSGNQRQYQRSTLRRIAFVQAAQRVGLALSEIKQALDSLPDDRTPTRADWSRLSKTWRNRLDQRIAELERLRDDLDGCIGCGCLSLQRCNLYNKSDRLAERGPGARILNVGIPGEL